MIFGAVVLYTTKIVLLLLFYLPHNTQQLVCMSVYIYIYIYIYVYVRTSILLTLQHTNCTEPPHHHQTFQHTPPNKHITMKKEKSSSSGHLDLRGDETSLLLLLFLYTLQGVPIGLAGSLPFLLQERGTSLMQQSMFSIASYPFSFKVLWAPILDAVFVKRFGRRKSWLVPVQILTGIVMIFGSSWLPAALNDVDVSGLTAYFFSLYFMMATQDIAVDGWALTMLSKRNVGLASTCNTIGQTIGYFSAYTGFLSLYSMGYVTLSSFVMFSGYGFLVATLLLLLKRERDDDDISENLLVAYRDTFEIVKLRPVRIYVLTILSVRYTFEDLLCLSLLHIHTYMHTNTYTGTSIDRSRIGGTLEINRVRSTQGKSCNACCTDDTREYCDSQYCE